MPLQMDLEIKQLFLPSSKDAADDVKEWVSMRVGKLQGGDLLSAMNDREYMLAVLMQRIVEWNVRGLDGEVAALTRENVRKLPLEDLQLLIEQFKGDEVAIGTDPKEPKAINVL